MTPRGVVNRFGQLYAELGLSGCSSHSGRRTFIARSARLLATIERPFDPFDIGWPALLDRNAIPSILIGGRGAYRHHSIVTGYSAGFRWVTITSYGSSADDGRARHRVPPQSLAALTIGGRKSADGK